MKLFAGFFIILIFIFLALPLSVIEAPEWDVQVVDSGGTPLSGVTVRESYTDYSASQVHGEFDSITDEKGRVKFPQRLRRVSGLSRVVGIVASLGAGVHGSFGRHAYVIAFGKCEGDSVKKGYIEDWTGHPSHNRSTIICR